MPNSRVKDAGTAGRGVFAETDVLAGEVIFRETRPLLAVLDSKYLKEACAWCIRYVGECDEEVSLNVCTGCRILRFCDVKCQSAAWKHSHKLECKIYKNLYPAVLPNTARMLMQLLLRRKKATFSQDEWTELYELKHHIDDFKKLSSSGNDTYENIQLMSRAAQEYGRTGDDLGLVETVAGRVGILINSLTLTTPLLTPLGIALSTGTALLNHSCEPNTAVTFSGPNLTLRALKAIEADTEMTISYIDNTFPTKTRREELQSRYFFRCDCSACSVSRTLGQPEIGREAASLQGNELEKLEQDVIDHLSVTAQAVSSSPKGLTHLARAMASLERYPSVPAWRQPFARVRSDIILQLLGHRYYLPALLQSLKQRFHVDPVAFPEEAHPARVSRTWVLSKLMLQMEAMSNENLRRTQGDPDEGQDIRDIQTQFGVDWKLLTWVLVKEVGDLVEESHGKGSRLDLEAKQAVKDMELGLVSAGKEVPGAGSVDECQGKMRRLADEGWMFWKNWERENRRKKPFVLTTGIDESDQDPIGVLIGERR